MNFTFTEEQEELRDAARAFLADHSSGDQVRQVMETDLGYDAEVWKRIGQELGWPCVIVPEDYGGIGLSWVELVALMWVGRGSFLPEEFPEALSTARTERVNKTEDYLLGVPLLADYLEDGLDRMGISVEVAEDGIL